MNRTKHLITAVAAVVVVVTGLSVTAAFVRHRAAAGGQEGEAGGHGHGANAQGMRMDEKGMTTGENQTAGHPGGHGGEEKSQPAAKADEKGMKMGEDTTAGHPGGHGGGEGKDQAAAPADTRGTAKPKRMQGRAMPSTAPSAAEVLEPLLSGSSADRKSDAGTWQQQQQPAAQQPEKSNSEEHDH